jgi:hypothetical protein
LEQKFQAEHEEVGETMRRVAFVYFDAGGGHRSAMNSLLSVIERQNRPWDVFTLNLQELLDEYDFVRKLTGLRMEDFYNRMIAGGWTLGTPQLLRLLQAAIWMLDDRALKSLGAFWEGNPADMVISVIPHFNRALAISVKRTLPGARFVTIITDLANYPPHFWMERESDVLICGTDLAVEQARALGHDNGRVYRTSGMVINPRFYEGVDIDRGQERQRLGLDPECPTGIVLFGGQGSDAMLEIAARTEHYPYPLQMIYICGRNKKLMASLTAMKGRRRRYIEGFTTEIPYFMRLADFFVGKPGPGSVSEALACGLPVIVVRNAWTLPQERYNAEWVRDRQFGVVLRSFAHINGGISDLLTRCDTYKKSVATYSNRAVFEIPDILQQVLEQSPEVLASVAASASPISAN